MLIKSLRMQLSEMLNKKSTIFTFFVLLAFVLLNFHANMVSNSEVQYITQMFDPIKQLTLSTWSSERHFLMQYYPFLVVVPTACAYLTDRDTRMKLYIESRCGKANYWYGKLLSVFIVTFLVFTIPFLIEIGLNAVCFDLRSHGDPSNFPYIDTIENENVYLWFQLYIDHKVLYAVLMTGVFGLASGILAMFNFAITTLPVFTYKIFTFFPIYLLIYLINFITKYLKLTYETNYYFVLSIFEYGDEMKYPIYGRFFLILMVISVVLVTLKTKRDDLL